MVQTPEHPSPGMELPSSHSSPLSTVPSPQMAAGVQEPSQAGPGGGFFAPESAFLNSGGIVVPASLVGEGISVGFFPEPSFRTTVASPLQPAIIADAPKATIDKHPSSEYLKLTTRS
jgi:hypothetical protein